MRRGKTVGVWATTLMVVPLIYALAAGPLVSLRASGRPLLSDDTFARLYHPLIRAEARVPSLGRAMHWYVSWWTPNEGPRTVAPAAVKN